MVTRQMGVEGVSKGQLGGFRRPVVANSEGTLPEESLDAHAAPHSVSNVFVMLCVIELGAFATVEPYVVLAVSGSVMASIRGSGKVEMGKCRAKVSQREAAFVISQSMASAFPRTYIRSYVRALVDIAPSSRVSSSAALHRHMLEDRLRRRDTQPRGRGQADGVWEKWADRCDASSRYRAAWTNCEAPSSRAMTVAM